MSKVETETVDDCPIESGVCPVYSLKHIKRLWVFTSDPPDLAVYIKGREKPHCVPLVDAVVENVGSSEIRQNACNGIIPLGILSLLLFVPSTKSEKIPDSEGRFWFFLTYHSSSVMSPISESLMEFKHSDGLGEKRSSIKMLPTFRLFSLLLLLLVALLILWSKLKFSYE
ncbi:hypothetical protein HWI79_3223 [Cryptosporidium felis]|nr:hypothetical protein HWI79_3223 [Cryptosporidium felis]